MAKEQADAEWYIQFANTIFGGVKVQDFRDLNFISHYFLRTPPKISDRYQ